MIIEIKQKPNPQSFHPKDANVSHLFHALDAARGIAALIVVLYHLPTAFRGTLFGSGDLAVDFFFALSGFVLAHAYLAKLVSGKMSFREFLIARVIRLYPLYALSLTATVVVLIGMNALGLPIPWTRIALLVKLPFAAMMLPSPSLDWHAYLFPFTIAAWSIFLEFAVNILFALTCKLLCKSNARLVIIGASGAILASQIITQNVLGGSSWDTLLAGIPRVCFSFFLGVHIHERLLLKNEFKARNNGYVTTAMLSLLLLTICAPENLLIKLIVIFLIFPWILSVLAQSEVPTGLVSSVVLKLGSLSYAIYIMHGPILFAWLNIYLTPGILKQMPTTVVVPILFSVILFSWVADQCFDIPVRRWINHRIKKRIVA